MKAKTLRRAIPALIVTATSTAPAGAALAASHAAATSKAKTQTFTGPLVDMRWGPVQAVIKVKNKKITAVNIVVNPDTNRSQFIDDQAVPILQQETLQAQSALISEVSGATMTSDAFMQSLQSAIKSAKKHKALK